MKTKDQLNPETEEFLIKLLPTAWQNTPEIEKLTKAINSLYHEIKKKMAKNKDTRTRLNRGTQKLRRENIYKK